MIFFVLSWAMWSTLDAVPRIRLPCRNDYVMSSLGRARVSGDPDLSLLVTSNPERMSHKQPSCTLASPGSRGHMAGLRQMGWGECTWPCPLLDVAEAPEPSVKGRWRPRLPKAGVERWWGVWQALTSCPPSQVLGHTHTCHPRSALPLLLEAAVLYSPTSQAERRGSAATGDWPQVTQAVTGQAGYHPGLGTHARGQGEKGKSQQGMCQAPGMCHLRPTTTGRGGVRSYHTQACNTYARTQEHMDTQTETHRQRDACTRADANTMVIQANEHKHTHKHTHSHAHTHGFSTCRERGHATPCVPLWAR